MTGKQDLELELTHKHKSFFFFFYFLLVLTLEVSTNSPEKLPGVFKYTASPIHTYLPGPLNVTGGTEVCSKVSCDILVSARLRVE